jgi:hypothetical protein
MSADERARFDAQYFAAMSRSRWGVCVIPVSLSLPSSPVDRHHENPPSLSDGLLVSVKVSVRQRRTTMDEATRRQAESPDLPGESGNLPVAPRSQFRLHTAEVTGSIPVAPTTRIPRHDRGFC